MIFISSNLLCEVDAIGSQTTLWVALPNNTLGICPSQIWLHLHYLAALGLWTASILKAIFLRLAKSANQDNIVHFADLRTMVVHKARTVHSQFSWNGFNPLALAQVKAVRSRRVLVSMETKNECPTTLYCSTHPYLFFWMCAIRRRPTLLRKASIMTLAERTSRALSFEYLKPKKRVHVLKLHLKAGHFVFRTVFPKK